MKKLLGKSLFLAVLAAVCLTATALAAPPSEGYVNADALRLRAEPSANAATITYLSSGEAVQILQELGDWFQVDYEGYTGYVFSAYISTHSSQFLSAAATGESMAGKMGVVTASSVNLRSSPSTDSDLVYATLDEGAQVMIDSISGGWCKVSSGGQQGFVNADYLSVDGLPLVNPKGVITGSCVNVRTEATTGSGILTKVYAGKMVDLIALEGDWYAVSVEGTRGYIHSDYLRLHTPGNEEDGIGAQAAASAYDYLGVRYVYGGASPKGFDCSGFTMYIYSLLGYSLPHSATSQWKNTGTYVERDDLQPGDLVLFCDPSQSNGKACSHVGIYVGDGQFIHATSSSTGYVRLNDLSESYYNNYYVGAKRVA